MSQFSVLREARAAWRTAHVDYYRMCQRYINQFVSQFRRYLEVPEYYMEYAGTDDDLGSVQYTKRKYVSIMEAKHQPDGSIILNEASYTKSLIDMERDDNGMWVAGIRLVIDNAENTWPKDAFNFQIAFLLKGETCTIRIGDSDGKTVQFKATEDGRAQKAFDHMIEWLHGVFQQDPSDTKPKDERIGFVIHNPE